MYIANYYIQGEVTHEGLPQWLVETTGLNGSTPDAVEAVIWINSNGGDLMAALESINLIASSKIPVSTIINGCAESAALYIAMAGHKRFVLEGSWGMAHHFSTGAEGNYHELMDSVKHNKLLHKVMEGLIKRFTKVPKEIIDHDFLGRGTTWLTDEELVNYGVVDKILFPGPKLIDEVLNYGKTSKKK